MVFQIMVTKEILTIRYTKLIESVLTHICEKELTVWNSKTLQSIIYLHKQQNT